MKTRNRLTVSESDVIAIVDADENEFGELQVRCLHHGQQRIRYIVVASSELEKKPFLVNILAEAQFNYRSHNLSFVTEELPTATALKVKNILTDLISHP